MNSDIIMKLKLRYANTGNVEYLKDIALLMNNKAERTTVPEVEVYRYIGVMDELIEWTSKQKITFSTEDIIKMASDIYSNGK